MINLSLHHLNSDVYFFYLDEKGDFSKTNNITSIHKIPNQQIHNIYAIDILFYKSKKYHENFLKTLWPSKRKCWKKKWMWTKVRSPKSKNSIHITSTWKKNERVYDLRQTHTWNYMGWKLIYQTKTQIRKKKGSKISTKFKYLHTIQLDKTLKYV